MGDEKKVYSFSEVSQHKTRKDCWLVINGKVYDVTKFLDDHPGGDEVLLLATGKDATDDFEDVGHSTGARETMEEYYVGEVDASTIIKRTIHEVSKDDRHNQKKDFEIVMIRVLRFLVPLAILGLGAGIPLYYAK